MRKFGFAPGTLGPHKAFGTGVLGVDFRMLDAAALGVADEGTPPCIDEVALVVTDEALTELDRLDGCGEAGPEA